MKRKFFLKSFVIILFSSLWSSVIYSQNIGINSTGANPNASAMLDIVASDKGLLIPRVSLTSTTDVVTIPSPTTSLLVYNNNAAMTGGSLGYWYWNGTLWVKLSTGQSNDWSITGNTGTVDGTNFIGTTDDVPFNLKVNNLWSGRIKGSHPDHTFFGYQSGNYPNNTGFGSVAIGKQALYSNTSGVGNIAIGSQALYYNQTTSYNIAIGLSSLGGFIGTGITSNVAVGVSSLGGEQTGIYNTGVGHEALYNQNGASRNTAIGYRAGRGNNTGSDNVSVGYHTGFGNVAMLYTFNQCVFLGSENALTTSRTNVASLGYGVVDAQCTANNQVLLGNTAITQIRAQITGITAYSDARFKTNITQDVSGLNFIMKLKPVTYNQDPTVLHKIWGTPDSLVNKIDHSQIQKQRFIGFLAQDVEKAAQESGFDFPGIDVPKNNQEVYSLRYTDFVMPLVKAMQEQQQMILDLKQELQSQKEINDKLLQEYAEKLKKLEENISK